MLRKKPTVIDDAAPVEGTVNADNLPPQKTKEKHSLLIKFSFKSSTPKIKKDDDKKQPKQTSAYQPMK